MSTSMWMLSTFASCPLCIFDCDNFSRELSNIDNADEPDAFLRDRPVGKPIFYPQVRGDPERRLMRSQ